MSRFVVVKTTWAFNYKSVFSTFFLSPNRSYQFKSQLTSHTIWNWIRKRSNKSGVFCWLSRCRRRGSLSTRDFETRTASGSELFCLITRLYTITFTMLSTFSRLWMISIKMRETPLSWHTECSLPVAVRVSKTFVRFKAPYSNQNLLFCAYL